MNLGRRRGLPHCVLLEQLRVRAPSPEAAARVERDRCQPGARVARGRAVFEGTLRIEERRLHDVLGIVMVVQLALDESHQPGTVLSIQSLDLGGHDVVVPADRGERTSSEAGRAFIESASGSSAPSSSIQR